MPSRTQKQADIVIKATDKASPALKQAAGSADKVAAATGRLDGQMRRALRTTSKFNKEQQDYILTNTRMRGATSGLRQTIGRLRNTILLVIFATAGFTQQIREAIRAANEMESALLGLTSVARNTGQAIQLTEDAAVSLTKNGLLTVKEASEGLRNLLAAGFGLREARQLMDALTDSAAFNRQGTLAMGQAIVGATQGIKNQNSIMVDNAGITKNLSVLYREYAATIGKTVGVLTEAEKRTAIYLGILREASVFAGDAEKVTRTLNGRISQFRVEAFETSAVIGKLMQPALSEVIAGMAQASRGIREWVLRNQDFIKQDVVGLLKDMVTAAGQLVSAFARVSPVFLKLAPAAVKLAAALFAFRAVSRIFGRISAAVATARAGMLAYQTATLASFAANERLASSTVAAAANTAGFSGTMTRLGLATTATTATQAAQALTTKQLSTAQVQAMLSSNKLTKDMVALSVATNVATSAQARNTIAMRAAWAASGPIGWAILALSIAVPLIYQWVTATSKQTRANEELLESQVRIANNQAKELTRRVETLRDINLQIIAIQKLEAAMNKGTSTGYQAVQQAKELEDSYTNLKESVRSVSESLGTEAEALTNLNDTRVTANKLITEYNEQLRRANSYQNTLAQEQALATIKTNFYYEALNDARGSLLALPGAAREAFQAAELSANANFDKSTPEGQKNIVKLADALKEAAINAAHLASVNPELAEEAKNLRDMSQGVEEFAGGLREVLRLRKEQLRIEEPITENVETLQKAMKRMATLGADPKTQNEPIRIKYGFYSPGTDTRLDDAQTFTGNVEQALAHLTKIVAQNKDRLENQTIRINVESIDFDKLFTELAKGFKEAAKDSPALDLTQVLARQGTGIMNRAQNQAFDQALEQQLRSFEENELAMTELARRLGVSREALKTELVALWRDKREKYLLDSEKTAYLRALDQSLSFEQRRARQLQELELAAMDELHKRKMEKLITHEHAKQEKELELRRRGLAAQIQNEISRDPRVLASQKDNENMMGISAEAGVSRQLESDYNQRVNDLAQARVQYYREASAEIYGLLEEDVAVEIKANKTLLSAIEARINDEAVLLRQRHDIAFQALNEEMLAERAVVAEKLAIRQELFDNELQALRNKIQLEEGVRNLDTAKFIAEAEERRNIRLRNLEDELSFEQELFFGAEKTLQAEHDLRVRYAEEQLQLERYTADSTLSIRRGLAEASKILPGEVAASFENSFSILGDRLVGNTKGTTDKIKEMSKDLTDFEAKLLEIQVEDKQKAFKKEITLRKAAGAIAISAAGAVASAVLKGLAEEAEAKAGIQAAEALAAFAKGNFAAGAGHLASAAKYSAAAGISRGLASVVTKRANKGIEEFSDRADQIERDLDTDGATSSGRRSIGGTVSAQNMSITIAPSVTIEASGDIFLSDGSVQELESNIGSIAVRSIQNAIDTNEIDLAAATGL